MYAAKIDINKYNGFLHLQILELAKMFCLEESYKEFMEGQYLISTWSCTGLLILINNTF